MLRSSILPTIMRALSKVVAAVKHMVFLGLLVSVMVG